MEGFTKAHLANLDSWRTAVDENIALPSPNPDSHLQKSNQQKIDKRALSIEHHVTEYEELTKVLKKASCQTPSTQSSLVGLPIFMRWDTPSRTSSELELEPT